MVNQFLHNSVADNTEVHCKIVLDKKLCHLICYNHTLVLDVNELDMSRLAVYLHLSIQVDSQVPKLF